MSVPAIVLPPSLKSRQSPAGSHHLGVKALFYGPPKSGKSFALASFPHPIFALACGENGIELYLKPELGDVSVFIDDADSYVAALEFALAHPSVKSIVVDNINLAFEDWMSSWEDKLSVDEIKGSQWKKVKGPWKALHRKVMHSTKSFGCSAWPKGAKYINEQVESSMPGIEAKGKLTILEQDAPHVERMLPFAVDLMFKTEIELNAKFAPTSVHRITFMGGRRPASIPANELYSGKHWRFDGKKVDEETPFEKVLKPIIEKWQNGAVEYVNLDEKEADREMGEADAAWQAQAVGTAFAALQGAATLAELKKAWDDTEADRQKLSPANRDRLTEVKNNSKDRLTKK